MKLLHLSVISIIGCLLGVVALLAFAFHSMDRMQVKQNEIADIVSLQQRFNSFSAASDSMLLFPPDPVLWSAYQAEAQLIKARLQKYAEDYPDALKAVHGIDQILESVGSVVEPWLQKPTGASETGGPLDNPQRSRLIMNQVAMHGIALDSMLNNLLRERRQTIAREANWIVGTFVGAAVLFGMLCVIAFGLIHRRVSRPVLALKRKIDRIREGEPDVRMEVAGNDELAEVATAFNRMVERQLETEDRLQRKQEELVRHERMLSESQRIAHIGSWRLYTADDRIVWSEETYRILGVSPDTYTPTLEAFFELVHPADLDALRREHDRARRGGQELYDIDVRVFRPDGELRHVHLRAEAVCDQGGDVAMLEGTIQDVTEDRRLRESLLEYRTLIEGSSELYGVCDADYRYVLVNQAYADWHGLDREAVIGRYLPEVLGEQYFREVVQPALDRCLSGEEQLLEIDRVNALGERRRIMLHQYPLVSPNDGRPLVAAVITDITELHEQSRLIGIAGRVALIGGWSVDLPSGRILWSDVVADIHGMPRGYSPTLEQGINFYAPEYRERIRSLFTACAEQGIPFDEELQIINAHGERVWVRAVGEPVRDSEGNITRVQGAFQDITARKAADRELERLSDRLAHVLQGMGEGFLVINADWRYAYVNPEAENLLGTGRNKLIGNRVWDVFPELKGTPFEQALKRAMNAGSTESVEAWYDPLGAWFEVRIYSTEEGLAVFFQDVTERHAMMEEMNHTLNLRQALINALPAHIALLDSEGNILDVNEQWRHFGRENAFAGSDFGVGTNYIRICDSARGDCADEAQEVGRGLREVLAGERDRFALEYPCHSPEQERWFRVMANRVGDAGSVVVMHVDITERKRAERELERLAYRDALTGLPSRNGFEHEVDGLLRDSGWQPQAMVVMLDLEGLRDINDSYGYAVGDQLLAEVGRRLLQSAGTGAVVGRIGGDEFGVFLPERNDRDAQAQRQALAAAFVDSYEIEELPVDVDARFGYTLLGRHPRSTESLMREAELALFRSRHDPSSPAWPCYSEALDIESRQRIELTRDLRRALEGGDFQLHFQPKVRLETGELIAAEALLRWNHPLHGLQSPSVFIPIAEQSQLIGPIGDWVVNDACRCLRQWRDAGLEIVQIAVNVSLTQFMVGDFPATVRRALEDNGLEPAALSLEITESVFERESEFLYKQLYALHELGVRLSLDDFGTGYSSLLYLQKYPFDEIKIDKSFVAKVLEDAYSRRIVTTVVGLAGALGAEVVAEGVESGAVRDALLELGCHIGQGFYYSMPLEGEDFRWLLDKHSVLPLAKQGTR